MTSIAIVTGASSGLGAELVRLLAEGAFGPLCIPSADMRALYVAAKLLPYPLALNLERALMRPCRLA